MTSRDLDVDGTSLNDWYYYDGNGKAKYPKLGNCFFKYKEYENAAGYEDLKNGRDFTVSSYKYKDNKKPGVGTVTFTMNFKGNYSGSVTKTLNFYIAPKLAKMTKVKAGKKSVKVKWKKAKDVSGYYVYVSKYPRGKAFKFKTVKGKNKTSYTVKGLKRHKTYYICVLTYTKSKGKIVESTYPNKLKKFRTK